MDQDHDQMVAGLEMQVATQQQEIKRLRELVSAFRAPTIGFHADRHGTFKIDFHGPEDGERAFKAMATLTEDDSADTE